MSTAVRVNRIVLALIGLSFVLAACAIKRPNPFLNTSAGRERLARLCESQLTGQLPEGALGRVQRGRFENDDAYGPAIYVFHADVDGAPGGRARFLCIGEPDGRVGVTLY